MTDINDIKNSEAYEKLSRAVNVEGLTFFELYAVCDHYVERVELSRDLSRLTQAKLIVKRGNVYYSVNNEAGEPSSIEPVFREDPKKKRKANRVPSDLRSLGGLPSDRQAFDDYVELPDDFDDENEEVEQPEQEEVKAPQPEKKEPQRFLKPKTEKTPEPVTDSEVKEYLEPYTRGLQGGLKRTKNFVKVGLVLYFNRHHPLSLDEVSKLTKLKGQVFRRCVSNLVELEYITLLKEDMVQWSGKFRYPFFTVLKSDYIWSPSKEERELKEQAAEIEQLALARTLEKDKAEKQPPISEPDDPEQSDEPEHEPVAESCIHKLQSPGINLASDPEPEQTAESPDAAKLMLLSIDTVINRYESELVALKVARQAYVNSLQQ